MRQGQADGSLVFRTFMTKLSSVDEIPDGLRKITEERLPEYFQAPPPGDLGQQERLQLQRIRAGKNEPLPPKD